MTGRERTLKAWFAALAWPWRRRAVQPPGESREDRISRAQMAAIKVMAEAAGNTVLVADDGGLTILLKPNG